MHMRSKKDLSSDDIEILRRSRTPSVVVTANWEVQTSEEIYSRFWPLRDGHGDVERLEHGLRHALKKPVVRLESKRHNSLHVTRLEHELRLACSEKTLNK